MNQFLQEMRQKLQNIRSLSDKNNLLSAYDIIEMHIDRYPNIIKKIEIRYGVIIKYNTDFKCVKSQTSKNKKYQKQR